MENTLQTIRNIFFVAGYFGLWIAVFVLLKISYGFSNSEALPALVLLAVILPLLALFSTRGTEALEYLVHRPAAETSFMIAYLTVIAALLVWGFAKLAQID